VEARIRTLEGGSRLSSAGAKTPTGVKKYDAKSARAGGSGSGNGAAYNDAEDMIVEEEKPTTDKKKKKEKKVRNTLYFQRYIAQCTFGGCDRGGGEAHHRQEEEEGEGTRHSVLSKLRNAL
jgi:hypothetical protein